MTNRSEASKPALNSCTPTDAQNRAFRDRPFASRLMVRALERENREPFERYEALLSLTNHDFVSDRETVYRS